MPTRIAVTFCAVLLVTLAAAENIRGVKFSEFTFPWSDPLVNGVPSAWRWMDKTPRGTLRLVKGRHDFSARSDPAHDGYLVLHSTTYGDLDGDGRDEAAVELRFGTGGTASWHYLYLYTLVRGAPRLLAILESGSRADGGLVKVEIRDRLLVLEFQDPERRMADCCSEGFVRVTYLWRQGQFVESGSRKYGDLEYSVMP
jgi:hypothetical protein